MSLDQDLLQEKKSNKILFQLRCSEGTEPDRKKLAKPSSSSSFISQPQSLIQCDRWYYITRFFMFFSYVKKNIDTEYFTQLYNMMTTFCQKPAGSIQYDTTGIDLIPGNFKDRDSKQIKIIYPEICSQ